MKHKKLIQIGHALGYRALKSKGICHGFSMMLVQAICCHGLAAFCDRMIILERYSNRLNALKERIEEIKRRQKERNPLSEKEKDILEIPAFFEHIWLYQNPEAHTAIFQKSLFQIDMLKIATYISSEKLEGFGGLHCALFTYEQYNEEKLVHFLNNIGEKLQDRPDAAILFNANAHAVVVRVLGRDQFQLIDINELDEAGLKFNSRTLAKKLRNETFPNESLMGIFQRKKDLNMTTSIFTSQDRVLNLKSLKVKDKIKIWEPAQSKAMIQDLDTLKRMDFDKVDVNSCDGRWTILGAACIHNKNEEIIDFLLDVGGINVNVPLQNIYYQPALLAMTVKNYHLYEKIAGHSSFDPNQKGFKRAVLSILATTLAPDEDTISFAEKIIGDEVEELNKHDEQGILPLYQACLKGYPKMALFFIDKGAHINGLNKDGQCALHATVLTGNLAYAKLLLRKGADCNIRDSLNRTPLVLAGLQHKPNYIPILLDKTELSIEDIKHPELINTVMQCEAHVQMVFLKKALECYIVARSEEDDYHNMLGWGYSKQEKLDAARCLLDSIDDESINLSTLQPILENGRLSLLYSLYKNRFNQVQIPVTSSYTRFFNALGAIIWNGGAVQAQEDEPVHIGRKTSKLI